MNFQWAIFNSYVKLPEGMRTTLRHCPILSFPCPIFLCLEITTDSNHPHWRGCNMWEPKSINHPQFHWKCCIYKHILTKHRLPSIQLAQTCCCYLEKKPNWIQLDTHSSWLNLINSHFLMVDRFCASLSLCFGLKVPEIYRWFPR